MTDKISTLGSVAKYINGRAFKPNEWEKIGKPIIRIQNLTNSSEICNRTTKNYDEKFSVTRGDLLFSWSATLGAYIWQGEDAWLNQHIFKVVPNNGVEKSYLYYYLTFITNHLYEKAHGSGMVHITLKPFKETEIPLPPLDEQQRIVDLLDELFAKLDEAKALAQAVVDGSELRRAAILHKAFAGELTKLWRDEHGFTLDTWQKKFLSELLLPMQTKRPTGETFRYIDIDSIDNERQTVRAPKIIKTIEAPSRASRAVESRNILFSMVRPYLKNIAFIDDDLKDCIASTGFFVCRCKEGLSPKFLYQFLCYDGTINYLMQFMRGDNSPSIRKDEFLGTSINLPPLDEQKEIVRLLDDLLGREQRTKDLATKTLERIELMKKSILARAFRGELLTTKKADVSHSQAITAGFDENNLN